MDNVSGIEEGRRVADEVEVAGIESYMAEVRSHIDAKAWHEAMLAAQQLVTRLAGAWAMERFRAGCDVYRPYMRGMQ